jgi:hypothetical protein
MHGIFLYSLQNFFNSVKPSSSKITNPEFASDMNLNLFYSIMTWLMNEENSIAFDSPKRFKLYIYIFFSCTLMKVGHINLFSFCQN